MQFHSTFLVKAPVCAIRIRISNIAYTGGIDVQNNWICRYWFYWEWIEVGIILASWYSRNAYLILWWCPAAKFALGKWFRFQYSVQYWIYDHWDLIPVAGLRLNYVTVKVDFHTYFHINWQNFLRILTENLLTLILNTNLFRVNFDLPCARMRVEEFSRRRNNFAD